MAPIPQAFPIICGRCLVRCFLRASPVPPRSRIHTHQKPYGAPDTIPLAGHAKLENRSLIALEGRDASRFLQGLTTANIPPEPSFQHSNPPTPSVLPALYSAFLNAQGRLLHDVFIYPIDTASYLAGLPSSGTGEPAFLLEVDAAEQDNLLRWLKRYKLRSKVTMRAVNTDECAVWSVWDSTKVPLPPQSGPPGGNLGFQPTSSVRLFADNRAPGLGYRLLQSRQENHTDFAPEKPDAAFLGLNEHSAYSTIAQYTVRRYLFGVPEGQNELLRETALIQESCLDYMGGVDFRKGCYVGQELVIRTQHTGVVRKRILPVLIHNQDEPDHSKLEYDAEKAREMGKITADIATGTDIVKADGKGRRVAKWIGGIGNLGLALWRLDTLEGAFHMKPDDSGVGSTRGASDLRFKPFVPDWWTSRKHETPSV
ncbi:ccr4 associated factor [Lambiella insularis]|nr:ccr4 associated factor [Lambiella insularis]